MLNTLRRKIFWPLMACVFTLLLFPITNFCHAALGSAEGNSWFIDMEKFSESAHGSIACGVCHGAVEKGLKPHPHLSDKRLLKRDAVASYDYSRCKTCHPRSYSRYLRGKHAEALNKMKVEAQKGQLKTRQAPTCGHCHDPHYDKPYLTRSQIGARMTEVCGLCHGSQKAAYLNDFHGRRAVNLAYEAAAYCTDCHGAHDCVSLKDKHKKLVVCRRCHPQANASFIEFVVHPVLKGLKAKDSDYRKRVAIIKVVGSLVAILVICIVAFFYGHSFLWLLRELHEKLRKHRS